MRWLGGDFRKCRQITEIEMLLDLPRKAMPKRSNSSSEIFTKKNSTCRHRRLT